MASQQTLERRATEFLIGAVEWVIQRLDLFAPTDMRVPDQMKQATELAMFYGYTNRWWGPHVRDRLVPVRQFLVDLFADPALAHWARRLPCHYSHYLIGYLALRAAGERMATFEEALTCVRRGGYPFVIEKMPHRELELQYSLWKAGLRTKRPGFGKLFRATSLGRYRNPAYLSGPEAYSITHTLFYVADIAGPCLDMPAADRRRAVDVVETLLVHYWRKPDWDLAGELLLNLVALDRRDTTLFGAAFAALLSAKRDDGAVPGPHVSADAGRGEPDRNRIFNDFYHTTLVAMFLCGAYIYRSQVDIRGPHAL